MRATTGETKLLPLPLASPSAGSLVVSDAAARRRRRLLDGLGGRRRRGRVACGVRLGRRLRGRRLGDVAVGRRRRRRRPRRPRARSPRASCRPRPSRPPGRGSRRARPTPGDGTSVSTLSVEISSSALVGLDLLAHLLEPLRDRPLGDGDAHLGHDDVDCAVRQPSSTPRAPLSPLTTSSTCGMYAFSSGGENGTGESGAVIRLQRRVEILERLLRDRRRDLGAEAAGSRVLVQHEHLRRLSRRLEHRLLVPRQDRAQVDDLDRDAVVELRSRPRRPCRPSRPT